MTRRPQIARVAIPVPLHKTFDYRVPAHLSNLKSGSRVRVPFGKASKIGLVLTLGNSSDISHSKLREIAQGIDEEPVMSERQMALLTWASDYYHYPIGEVFAAVVPAVIRQGKPSQLQAVHLWSLTEKGRGVDLKLLGRAVRQRRLLKIIQDARYPVSDSDIAALGVENWKQILKRLQDRGWVQSSVDTENCEWRSASSVFELNKAQTTAVNTILEGNDGFRTFLLDGVTGSGKTEVYLEVIRQIINSGKQALVLVPEIGLTPQTLQRFQVGLDLPLGVFHSAMSDHERFAVWAKAREGTLPVIIGTRSAVWIPIKRLGVVIVDEEHDPSYKQQDGFRYCARDVSILRGSRESIPIILGSATPSMETLFNVRQNRYVPLRLPRRAGGAALPSVTLINVRGRPYNDGVSIELATALEENFARNEQSLLLLNRRGYAPVLLCHECGWVAECHRCDSNMVLHQEDNLIRCHHCGAQAPQPLSCAECGSNIFARGLGTQRLSQALAKRFPFAKIIRIDRDSTRKKGSLEQFLTQINNGEADILIGTQMLAKGHHFPYVSLVGILDADGGLYGADFRSGERMAQLIVQVSGRAGREQVPGRVLIQTRYPEHPMLKALLTSGYRGFSDIAMSERELAEWPPFSNLGLLRAEATFSRAVFDFLNKALTLAKTDLSNEALDVFGPVPSPMERKAGRYRAQLLVQSHNRSELHQFMRKWLPKVAEDRTSRRVRWSLDIDPRDMF